MSRDLVIVLAMLGFAALVVAASFLRAFSNVAAKREIMRQLADGDWHYGLDLIEASNGRLGRGTVYIHLSRLEDLELVESRFEPPQREGHLPRRLYRMSIIGAINRKS